jgi:hypothetical protein
MNYRIIISGFQSEFECQEQASEFAKVLLDAGVYYMNVDETKRPKGIANPTVFVKQQTVDEDSLEDVAGRLLSLHSAFQKGNVKPVIAVKTIIPINTKQ